MRVAFPPEARRPPLAGSTQRPKSQPPPPLKLDDQNYTPFPPLPKTGNALTILVEQPDSVSPTPSDASSLSLYSPDDGDVAKNFPIEREQKEEEKRKNLFCCCFGFFSQKSKEARILGPPAPKDVQPTAVPEMTQIGRGTQTGRRRPSPLNL